MARLAICAIFKGEARFILEWIAYHRLIGFDEFVLYDHDSTDGAADLIRRSIFAPDVTIIHWTVRPGQMQAYRHYIDHHSHRHDWVAFLDCDEFLHPLDHRSVRPLLPLYDGYGAVLLHWRTFGPSGHIVRPAGLVIDSYRQRYPLDHPVNGHVKTLARVSALRDVSETSHMMRVEGPTCLANGTEVYPIPLRAETLQTHAVINHYFTKSVEDWVAKTGRRKADTPDRADLQYPHLMLIEAAYHAVVPDDLIGRFLPDLGMMLRCAT